MKSVFRCWRRAVRVILFGLLVQCGIHQSAARPACPCVLSWDGSLSPVTGYAIYYGIWDYFDFEPARLDAGTNLQASIPELEADQTYLFYVVAYTDDGTESDPSDAVLYTPPAMSPLHIEPQEDGTMSLNFSAGPDTECWIEFTSSLENPDWQFLGSAIADPEGHVIITDPLEERPEVRFYRAVQP